VVSEVPWADVIDPLKRALFRELCPEGAIRGTMFEVMQCGLLYAKWLSILIRAVIMIREVIIE